MDYSTWSYIIPPYLLNTCYGGHLRNCVSGDNPTIRARNAVPCSAPYREIPHQASRRVFSQNPGLNSLILLKLAQHLFASGVFGQKPPQSLRHNEEQLLQYFETYEEQIMSELDNADTVDVIGTLEDDRRDLAAHPIPKSTRLISKPVVGEAISNAFDWPLTDLLRYVKEMEWMHNVLTPGLKWALQLNPCAASGYTLPISWAPLFLRRQLSDRHPYLEMDISNKAGFLELTLMSRPSEVGEQTRLRHFEPGYFNFVADTPIERGVGIFYYEVEIEQTCTQATHKTPIISLKDTLISTELSICLSLGYCRSSVQVDNLALSNRGAMSPVYVLPLDHMRREMFHNRQQYINPAWNFDPASVFGSMPGEFEGSYAMNLADLTFLNSSKISDTLTRPIPNPFGRRYSSLSRSYAEHTEPKSTDMGVKFKIKATKDPLRDVYTSSCIGVGINFVEKTIFFTLDGVMVQTLLESELSSSDPCNTLFSNQAISPQEGSVLPMLGIKLSDINSVMPDFEPSRTTINTNFGHREFRFDINNYTRAFKASRMVEFKSELQKTSENPAQGVSLDIPPLNQLVREYLDFRGYFETLKLYDTEFLATHLEDNESRNLEVKNSIHERTHLKQLCLSNDFNAMIMYLRDQFIDVCDDLDIIFRIKCAQFDALLESYLKLVVNAPNGSTSEFAEEALVALRNYHDDLKCYENYHDNLRLHTLEPLMLVKDVAGFENLPQASSLLGDRIDRAQELFHYVNDLIITTHTSTNDYFTLHDLINEIETNIVHLGYSLGNNNFALVNFEDDFID